jgi:hypothetical protein
MACGPYGGIVGRGFRTGPVVVVVAVDMMVSAVMSKK